MHGSDTDSSCSQFDEDLTDGMPFLISFPSQSFYIINNYIDADANMETEGKKIPILIVWRQVRNAVERLENINLGVTYLDFSMSHLF